MDNMNTEASGVIMNKLFLYDHFWCSGSVVYKRNLAVQGSTEVQSVNGVPWGELLPLNAPVSVSGFYTFARATVNSALRSDNINGLDLSEEAVLLDLDQNVQGEGPPMSHNGTCSRSVVVEKDLCPIL